MRNLTSAHFTKAFDRWRVVNMPATYNKKLGHVSRFLDHAYRVNVRGPFRLMQRVSEVMARHGGGTIVNITSGAARHPQAPAAQLDAMDPSYGITKAALDRITSAYAGELKAQNIALVAVSPGLVITERIHQAAIRRNVDFSRAESPDVIASAVEHVPTRNAAGLLGRRLCT